MQMLLAANTCSECGSDYRVVGYWRDNMYCPSCSAHKLRQEEQRKKRLASRAAKIREKYGLDFSKYPSRLPEEILRELNPKNAGRKETKWDECYCELLVESAAEGKTEAEFAAQIQISQGLINHWTEEHPNFKAARETANELREACFERTYRDAMLGKIPCVPNMLIRYMAAKYGWRDKSESVISGSGGEIPVVQIVKQAKDFPSETLAPTKEQVQAAGLEGQAV